MSRLGLYIHLPYCVHRCVYCDFNVSVIQRREDLSIYLNALLKEIRFYAACLNTKTIDSIFFGGGTPSLFSAKQIEMVLHMIRSHYSISSDLEITLEANPNSAVTSKLKELREIGINRLSFGVQSFQKKHLKTLERSHSSEQSMDCILNAKSLGFNNINVDLIFGIPHQLPKDFQSDLEKVTTLDLSHISTYQLTLDKTNPLYPNLPSDEELVWFYEEVIEYLCKKGYDHYEISAFAKPGMK